MMRNVELFIEQYIEKNHAQLIENLLDNGILLPDSGLNTFKISEYATNDAKAILAAMGRDCFCDFYMEICHCMKNDNLKGIAYLITITLVTNTNIGCGHGYQCVVDDEVLLAYCDEFQKYASLQFELT